MGLNDGKFKERVIMLIFECIIFKAFRRFVPAVIESFLELFSLGNIVFANSITAHYQYIFIILESIQLYI